MSDSQHQPTSRKFDPIDQDEYICKVLHAIDTGNKEGAKTAVKGLASICWYMLSLTSEMRGRIEYLENEAIEASASTLKPWDPYDPEEERTVREFTAEFEDKIASKIDRYHLERIEMYKRAVEKSVCQPPKFAVDLAYNMK